MKAIDIFNKLGSWSILKELEGPLFTYSITKNYKLMLEEAKTIEESKQKINDSFKEQSAEYEIKRMDLIKALADKDSDGNPIISNGQFEIKKEIYLFNSEIERLQNNYKDLINEMSRVSKINKELMEKDIEIKFNKIKLDDVPKNINTKQMELIFDFVE